MAKEKKSLFRIILGILSVFATIVIPILSWEPIKSGLDNVFSNSSFWNSVWLFLTKPRFGLVTIIWILLFGFVIYKLFSFLLKQVNFKEKKYIKETPKQMEITEKIIAQFDICFSEGQPMPTDVIMYCSVGNCSQQLNHYSHNSCINSYGCSENCQFRYNYHTAVDVVTNGIKSELMKRWNGFIKVNEND